MTFSPVRTDASGKRQWDSRSGPTSPQKYSSPATSPTKGFTSSKRICTISPGKENITPLFLNTLTSSPQVEKKLSLETLNDVECWKKYLLNEKLVGIDVHYCMEKFRNLEKKFPNEFHDLFVLLLIKPLILEITLSINFNSKFSINCFIDIINHELFNDHIFTLEQITNLFPLHSDSILPLFLNALKKNDFFICEVLINEHQYSLILSDLIEKIKDYDLSHKILQKIYDWKHLNPQIIGQLLFIIDKFLDSEFLLANLETLVTEDVRSLALLYELTKLNVQALWVLARLNLLDVKHFNVEKFAAILVVLAKPDFPIGNFYNSLRFFSDTHFIVELLLHTPTEVITLLKLNDSGKVVFDLICLLSDKKAGFTVGAQIDPWINIPSSVPMNMQMKLRVLMDRGFEKGALQILEIWNQHPNHRNLLRAVLKIAVENNDMRLAHLFFEINIGSDKLTASFFTYLIESENEAIISAYQYCTQQSDLKELADAALAHFKDHKELNMFFQALLHNVKKDKEKTKQFFPLFSSTDLPAPQSMARYLLSSDGNLKIAELVLQLPNVVFEQYIQNLTELNISARVWKESHHKENIPLFLSELTGVLEYYRTLKIDDAITTILNDFTSLNQSLSLFGSIVNVFISKTNFLGNALAKHCVLDNGQINLEWINHILFEPSIKKLFDDDILEHLISRLKTLSRNLALKNEMEALEFDGNQEGPIALLIRASLNLPHNHKIVKTDLVKVVLASYFHLPITIQDRCAGVSGLELFFITNPLKMLEWIQELTSKGKLEFFIETRTEVVFPNIVPDTSFLNTELKLIRHDPQFIGTAVLARYLNISEDKTALWYLEAFDHCAKAHLQTQKSTLNVPTKSFLASLIKTANKFTEVPFNDDFETNNFDCGIVLAGVFEPLLCRTLQSAILSTDSCAIEGFRINTFNTICELLEQFFKNEDESLKAALKASMSNKLNASTTLFFTTSVTRQDIFRNATLKSNKFNFRNPKTILSKNTYNKFIFKFLCESLNSFSKEQEAILPSDFNTLVLEFTQFIQDKFPFTSGSRVLSSNANTSKDTSDWVLASGADITTLKNLKETTNTSSVHLARRCNTAKDVKDFIVEYVTKFDINMSKFARRPFAVPGHAANFILDHASLSDLAQSPSANMFFDKYEERGTQLSKLELPHATFMHWASRIQDLLPLELKTKWGIVAELMERGKDKSFHGSFIALHSMLIEICGSVDKVRDNFGPVLDLLGYEFLQSIEEGKAHKFLHIANTNWICLDTGMHKHYALWFNPGTLQWDFWYVNSDEKGFEKAKRSLYFGADNLYQID